MRFAFPRFPAEFEIPDDWWLEAGMQKFVSRALAYRSSTTNELIALDEVEPPFNFIAHRLTGTALAAAEWCPS